MEKLIDRPRLFPILIVLACAGILAAALASEHWGGLKPCILCTYQRYAYAAAGALGLAGVLIAGRLALLGTLTALTGLVFLTGAGIAVFHVGVEQRWWRGTAECHAPALDLTLSIDELREQMLATDFVPCDEVQWALFGVSLAGYNVLLFLALAITSLWAASAMLRRARS